MKDRNNIISIFLLILIFIFIGIASYGKGGSFIWDHFREATIADAILEGKVLYKDIMALFAPLSFYLNAFLFSIFSSNLNVLYCAGIVNSIIILVCIYKIMYEISSVRTAFITVLSVMFISLSCKISILSNTNWFFPYTYSFIYAFSSCMIALTFFILYLKKNKLKHLYFACFFTGLSISFKFDYTCFSIVLFLSFLRLNSLRKFLTGLCFIAIPILFTFLLLYIQAGNNILNVIYDEIIYLYKYIKNPYTIAFYKEHLPLFINAGVIKYIIYSFFSFCQYFIFPFLILFMEYNLLIKKKVKYTLAWIVISSVLLFILLNLKPYFLVFSGRNLVFLNHLVLLSAVILFIYNIIKKIPFSKKEKLFYILLLICYLINFRSFVAIYISYIGRFNIIYFWMIFIYLIFEIVPEKFPNLNTKCYKNSLCISLILYSLFFSIISLDNYKLMKYKIQTSKGFFYTAENYYNIIKPIFKHAQENIIGKNKTLLYIPEGSYIHYMLDIPLTDMYLYQLQSHTTPAIGEKYVIEKIKNKKIDYIYIFLWVSETDKFGIKFGFDIYNYIRKNYELEEIIYFESNICYIYKIKQKVRPTTFREDYINNNLVLTKSLKTNFYQ